MQKASYDCECVARFNRYNEVNAAAVRSDRWLVHDRRGMDARCARANALPMNVDYLPAPDAACTRVRDPPKAAVRRLR
jgi:hypothetical protein